MSYKVAQRTDEIGIRVALGAQRAGVIRMILRDVLTTVLMGLAAGVPGALLASKLVSSFLYGIKRDDPLVLAAAVYTRRHPPLVPQHSQLLWCLEDLPAKESVGGAMRRTFAFGALLIFLPSCGTKESAFDATITLYPEASRELSGYQKFTLAYDPRRDLRIRDITADVGNGPQSILTAATHLLARDGTYELTWCAQCAQAPQVKLAISFEGDVPPVRRTYRLRARPTVNIAARFNAANGAITLDASESFSPVKKPLLFSWRTGKTVVTGASFTAAASALAETPAALTVSDELTETNQIVTVKLKPNGAPELDPQGRPAKVYTEEQLKCTDLQIVNNGFSLINPSVQLGPDPAADEQIPVADGKVSRDYMLNHRFDIVATIAPQEQNLREGQDVAVTTTIGTNVKKLRGKTRAVGAAAGVFGPEIEAPYPNPAPADALLNPAPPMVEDGYEAHPLNGLAYVNTPQGVSGLYVKKKDFDSSKTKLVWFDQPVLPLRADTPINGGGSKHMYVHVWLIPDQTKCEKYFKIEMDYDATGKVTKNKLTALN